MIDGAFKFRRISFLICIVTAVSTLAATPSYAIKLNNKDVLDRASALDGALSGARRFLDNKKLSKEEFEKEMLKKEVDKKLVEPAKNAGKKIAKKIAKGWLKKLKKSKKYGKIASKAAKKLVRFNPYFRAVGTGWNIGTTIGDMIYEYGVGPLMDRHFEKKREKKREETRREIDRIVEDRENRDLNRNLDAHLADVEDEWKAVEYAQVGYRGNNETGERSDNGYRDSQLGRNDVSTTEWLRYKTSHDPQDSEEAKAAREQATVEMARVEAEASAVRQRVEREREQAERAAQAARSASPSVGFVTELVKAGTQVYLAKEGLSLPLTGLTSPSLSGSGTARANNVPSGNSGYCKKPDQKVLMAMNRIKERASASGGISDKYCGAVNLARALNWKSIRCLDDPTLNNVEKSQVRDQIEANRENIRQNLKGFRSVSEPGSLCGCWTDVCAD